MRAQPDLVPGFGPGKRLAIKRGAVVKVVGNVAKEVGSAAQLFWVARPRLGDDVLQHNRAQ